MGWLFQIKLSYSRAPSPHQRIRAYKMELEKWSQFVFLLMNMQTNQQLRNHQLLVYWQFMQLKNSHGNLYPDHYPPQNQLTMIAVTTESPSNEFLMQLLSWSWRGSERPGVEGGERGLHTWPAPNI